VAYLADVTALEKNLDDIESDFHGRVPEQMEIIQPAPREAPPPNRIDCRRGSIPFFRRSGFHLNKHQAIGVPENQIDFAPRRTKIRC
jgi:hypothetical protein